LYRRSVVSSFVALLDAALAARSLPATDTAIREKVSTR
jgi:hypothetical protein